MNPEMSQEQDILSRISKFQRPVAAEEIDAPQLILDSLVASGSLKTLVLKETQTPISIYWIPPTIIKPEDNTTKEELEDDISKLKERLKSLNEQLDPHSSVAKSMSPKKKQINKLHDYNDIKDAAQILLGKLAEIEGVMTIDLYSKYGLSREDSA